MTFSVEAVELVVCCMENMRTNGFIFLLVLEGYFVFIKYLEENKKINKEFTSKVCTNRGERL